jgi:hypothetical protein
LIPSIVDLRSDPAWTASQARAVEAKRQRWGRGIVLGSTVGLAVVASVYLVNQLGRDPADPAELRPMADSLKATPAPPAAPPPGTTAPVTTAAPIEPTEPSKPSGARSQTPPARAKLHTKDLPPSKAEPAPPARSGTGRLRGELAALRETLSPEGVRRLVADIDAAAEGIGDARLKARIRTQAKNAATMDDLDALEEAIRQLEAAR